MTCPAGEHAESVRDNGRETARWSALAFGIMFVCVLALHAITE